MHRSAIRISMISIAVCASAMFTVPDFASPVEASSVSDQRSRQCSAEARRWADRHTRQRTAAGALIGGGAGLISGGGRWQTYYNYAYRNCVRR